MSRTDTASSVLYVPGTEPSDATDPDPEGRVLWAADAADALATIDETPVDCVVVDTGAAAVARHVRERHPTVPLVLRTEAGPVPVATGPVPAWGEAAGDDRFEACVATAVAAAGDHQGVLDALDDGVYALDADLRFVAANGALADLAGREHESLLGEHVSLVLDDAGTDAVRDRLAAFGAGERDGRDERDRRDGRSDDPIEVELQRADGERLLAEVGVSPIESDGEVVGVAGVVRDVSERRERRREGRLRESMVDAVTDGLYALDGDRNVLAASEGFARLAGRDLESLVGEHVSVCVDRETIEENVEERRAIMEGEQAYGEWEFDVVRPDGERVPVENRYTGLPTEAGLYGTAGVMRDIRDRRERERELELWRAMVDTVTDGLYVLDADRNVVAVNEAFAELVGRDVESLLGEHVSAFVDEATIAATETGRRALLEGELAHERHEFDVVRPDGERTPVEARYTALPDPADVGGTAGVVRDVTDRRRRERALAELHDWTRRMVRAEVMDDVFLDLAADRPEFNAGAVRALFDDPGTGVYALDDAAGGLVLVGSATGNGTEGSDLPAVLTDGPVWDAFLSGERRAPAAAGDGGPDPLGAGQVHPLGTHGVVVAGWGREEPVPGDTGELLAVLSANVETALDRAAVESTLRDRERRLVARNEELARLDRTNTVIRGVHRALVSAGSREAGRVAVADRLAAADPYAVAWFARVTGEDGAVEPIVGGGDAGAEYVDALHDRLEGSPIETLVAEAAAAGEVRTRRDVLDDADWLPLRADALAHGYRSVAAIPVTASGGPEEVLVIHGTDAEAFPPAETEVLAELGGLIGRTLRAVEPAGVGSPDHRVAVELDIPGARLVFNRVSAAIGTTVTLEGSVPLADGNVVSYVSAPVEGGRLAGALRERDGVTDVAVIAEDDDGSLVELRKSNCELTTLVHDAGGRLRSVSATGERATATLDLPVEVEVRAVVEAVGDAYPGTTLRARRERASPDTPRTVRAALRETCTDRQYEALVGAYYSGYYDWPRLTTAAGLADRSGVSSPTFQYHLRTGERKLLDLVVG